MWKVEMKAKRLFWKAIAQQLWWISEALRKDYGRQLKQAQHDGMAFPSFSLWVSRRVFGDESGYRFDP